MSGRKKKLLIALIIFLAVLVSAVSACVYFIGTDNLKSVYYGVKYKENEIVDLQAESSKRLQDELDKYEGVAAREPTEDEVKAIESGEITEEQLVDIISSGTTLEEYRSNDYAVQKPKEEAPTESGGEPSESPPAESKPQEPQAPQPEEKDADAQCDEEVSRIVTKMYILRSSYSGSLSSLLSQAYAEYTAGGSKSEIASKYIGMGQALEAQCDGNVNALMGELTGILTANGRSTELVDSIYQAYNGEKQYTKAYYMSMYLNN